MISLCFFSLFLFYNSSKLRKDFATTAQIHHLINEFFGVGKSGRTREVVDSYPLFATQFKMKFQLPDMKQFIGKCLFLFGPNKKKASVSMVPFGKLRRYMENPALLIGLARTG